MAREKLSEEEREKRRLLRNEKNAEHQRRYRANNKELISARVKIQYEANKEKNKAYAKAYYEANKERDAEKNRARARAWRESNKERANARVKKWIKANKERANANTRKWLEANPERASALNVRRELKGRHGITNPPEDLVNLIVANRKLKRAIREVCK